MLMNSLEKCYAMLSLVCMFLTLVSILRKKNCNCIPVIASCTGTAFYLLFLASALNNMDSHTQHTFLALLVPFAMYIIVACIMYKYGRKNRKEKEEKLEFFKKQCREARGE